MRPFDVRHPSRDAKEPELRLSISIYRRAAKNVRLKDQLFLLWIARAPISCGAHPKIPLG
jgi:hypothetical protein